MKKYGLKTQIFLAFSLVIVIIGFLSIIFGSYIIQNKIIQRAHRTVTNAIRNAEAIYRDELDKIGRSLSIVGSVEDLNKAKEILGWDYAFEVTSAGAVESKIVREAFAKKSPLGASRVISREELENISLELPDKLKITLRDTPRSKPSDKKILDSAIALEYAMPVIREDGTIQSVRYAGKIINRDFS